MTDDDGDSAAAKTASDDGEKTYLNCPFDDKDECKALGGRWDGDAKNGMCRPAKTPPPSPNGCKGRSTTE